MHEPANGERRAEPRVETEEPVVVHLRAAGHVGKGRLVDINNKGAFVETDLTLDSGVTLVLEIEIQGSERPESIRGAVARRHDGSSSGLGIEFLPTSVEERDHIFYVVKTILALDLLGYEKEKRRKPTDTIVYRAVRRSSDDRS